MNNNTFSISIMTATGCQNLGDELILQQELMYLHNRYPNAHFIIFSYDTAYIKMIPLDSSFYTMVSYFPNNIRKNPLKNIYYFLRGIFAIYKSKFVIIGGGGLFYGDENPKEFSKLIGEWYYRVWLARIFKKPIYFWSLSLELKRETSLPALKKIFLGKNTHISFRDVNSKTLLKKINITSDQIPDPVFLYSPKEDNTSTSNLIGVSIRAGYLKNEEESIRAIVHAVRNRGFEPIFLFHSLHQSNVGNNDKAPFEKILSELGVQGTKNLEETLDMYGKIRFSISMRLHANILSAIHTIPFITISYSQKTTEIGTILENPYLLQAQDFAIDEFIRLFNSLLSREEEIKIHLKSRHKQLILEIKEGLSIFFKI